MTYKPSFGSISHGTMCSEDLIPAFADELRACADGHPGNVQLADEADQIENYDSDEAAKILSDLFDILNEYAPPYGYFGAHPGDGADYGFWLCEDFEQMIIDDGGIKANDLADIPVHFSGEALVMNDHGNATLYSVLAGNATEIWSVV